MEISMKMSWIRKIVINCKHIKSRDDFHNEFEGASNTDGYGRNLDALYDELTSSNDLIILENVKELEKNLSEYGSEIISIFRDAMEYNENLIVIFR